MRINIVFILSILIFSGCAPKEPELVIKRENDGIKCDSISVLYMNSPLKTNIVCLDSTIEMVFYGLGGFRENTGIVYPGGTLKVIDKNNEVIFSIEDVFLNLSDSGADKNLVNKKITMVLETGSPMKKGETYTWENTIWDKRANRKIKAKTTITVRN